MKPSSLLASLALTGVLSACGPGELPESQQMPAQDLGRATAALDCAALSKPVYHRVRPSSGDSLLTLNANEAANAATTCTISSSASCHPTSTSRRGTSSAASTKIRELAQ